MMTRVLVIDDSSFQRKIISSVLAAEGHEVISAQNGLEGLAYLAGDLPDLVVLDLLMPEMDGLEVLARMREQGVRVPVIVLTADIQDSTKERCIRLGAAMFINKPVKKDALSAAVREVLGVKGA
jgi:twitching motility two-component system response regulator PilH